MNRRYLIPLLMPICGLSSLAAETAPALSNVVDTYCSDCHNGQMKSPSGKLLEQFDTTQIAQHPDIWARVYRQLQAGAMPPMGAPRPDRTVYAAALASIDKSFAGSAATKPQAASNQQIATRLATLLWHSDPDEALLKDAQRNRLTDSAVLEGQVRRMLADDRAQAFTANFFFPWLQLNELSKADPDKKYFPDYDPSLRDALARETEMFLLSQLRADRDPLELWSANYSFLNEQVAKHYGIANVAGPQFRRVEFSAPERGGLLGQGSILMVTSRHQHGVDAGYTSPAARAKWIRFHFLGIAPPNPFPGALPVNPELPITPQTRKLAVTPCVTCHQNFFPLGYALEGFDPIGRRRTQDQIGPVDASGMFVDGTQFDGVAELRRILLQYPEAFRTTITEKLVGFAANGTVSPFPSSPEDLIRARRILRNMPSPRWSAIITAVVRDGAE